MHEDDALEAEYELGVREAQAFIDRHPHGFPAQTMAQYGKPGWSEVNRAG